jgi:DNA-binding MarR family transcriptional regulator
VARSDSRTYEEAIELVYFAHRELVGEPDRLLARRGLGRVHHRILYCIARRPGITVGDVCRVLAVTKQALHQPLATLVATGLVARTVDPTNRRVRNLALTARGTQLEQSLAAVQRRRFEHAFRAAGPAAVASWRAVMRLLAAAAVLVVIGCSKSTTDELAIPDVEQATDYTCSASALQGVLAYYGSDVTEAALATELGATPEDGAPPEAIERVARAHQLDATARDGVTRAELAAEIAARRPVIVDLQAWSDAPRASWADDWDDGHYAVLIAIDGDTLVFEDPSLAGKHSILSADELDARWHDEDAHRRHSHTAIVFHTPPPAHPRAVPALGREHMQ